MHSVVSVSTLEIVITEDVGEDVVSVATNEDVIGSVAFKDVVAVSTSHSVIAATGADPVDSRRSGPVRVIWVCARATPWGWRCRWPVRRGTSR